KSKAATHGNLGANGAIKTRREGLQKAEDILQSQDDSTKEALAGTRSVHRAQSTRPGATATQTNSISTDLTQQYATLSGNSNKYPFGSATMTYAARRPAGYSARSYTDIGLETQVMSASPERLITLLFNGARAAIAQARLHLESGRIAERG